ncbi:MAG: methyltransferase domain-containing protein [Bryobacteraceae bacterium]|nr:methyltransferase domain-containing protein [Bryobacteraceae bacterium]
MRLRATGPRLIRPEILDTLPAGEARASLADLTRINRETGAYRVLRELLATLVRAGESFTMLDVGAASGDLAAETRRLYPGARVTLLDYALSHLPSAGDRVAADAFRLPFRDGSFDFVFSSLFLHHFSNEDVIRLYREGRRVARQAVLTIDLERHPLAYYFLPATRWWFGWDQVTLHDGPISVEASFRPPELRELAEAAGLTGVRVRRHRPSFRLSLMGRAGGGPSRK